MIKMTEKTKEETREDAKPMLLIDGANCVLGRVAAHAAKQAMQGQTIKIFNAEKMVITGNRRWAENEWKRRRGIKVSTNPEKSPKFPRRPDLFVKKTINGMLPRNSSRGKEALKRIKIFMGAPQDAQGAVKISECTSRLKTSVGDVCKALGWNA